MGPGGAGYGWSKRVLIDYVDHLCLQGAPKMIRVNAMHPTNVNTHLQQNDGIYSVFRPDMMAEGTKPTLATSPGSTSVSMPGRCSSGPTDPASSRQATLVAISFDSGAIAARICPVVSSGTPAALRLASRCPATRLKWCMAMPRP